MKDLFLKNIFWLFLLVAATVTGQDVRFYCQAPKRVAVNQAFYLAFVIENGDGTIKLPELKNFSLQGGPSKSQSSQTQIFNGKVSQSTSVTYRYVIAATKEGTFTIPKATVTIDGKTYSSNPVTIEVVKGNGNAQAKSNNNRTQSRSNDPSPSQGVTVDAKDVFVRVQLNKTNLYQGEATLATIKLYTKLNIAGVDDLKMPAFNNLWIQDIKGDDRVNFTKETVNGEVYYTGVLAQKLIFPQKSGKITIEPFDISLTVQKKVRRKRRRRRSFFDDFFDDDFFGGGYRNIPVKLKSPARVLHVKPLPENRKPANFDGAVGDLGFKVTVDKTTVKTNDPITMTIAINGKGNLKLIEAPKPDIPPDFEMYDPKVETHVRNTTGGQKGSKSFEYLIIPRVKGDYVIPPLSFSYFDPEAKTYKTVTSDTFNIHVEQGDGSTGNDVVFSGKHQELKYLGKDIRFIKAGATKLHRKGDYVYGQKWYFSFFPVTFLLFALVAYLLRKQIKENADFRVVRRKKAGKFAAEKLKNAHAALQENDKNRFYEASINSLWGYLQDKLNVPRSELSRATVTDILRRHKVTDTTIDRFIKLIEKMEMAHFAPIESSDMHADYESAKEMINLLEKEVR